MTSKGANENDKPVLKKVKTKNNKKGGDSNDFNPGYETDLIERAFLSLIIAEFIECKKNSQDQKRNITNHRRI